MHELGNGMIKLPLKDCDICYYPDVLPKNMADELFAHFYSQVPWQQDDIRIFGKTYLQPRLTALYGNNGKSYTYSNLKMEPLPFSRSLLALKSLAEEYSNVVFTTCLLNLYRTGSDSNGWHADDEKELGPQPVIASISLGQERYFHLRHKKDKELKYKLLLEHGSLLLMKRETQHHWKHQIPKSKKPMNPRINLTFRVIK